MPELLTGLVTMAVSQLFDLGTFVAMIRRLGPGAEANPFIADVLTVYGVPLLAVTKVALVIFVGSLTVVLAGRAGAEHPRLGAAVLAVAIVAGLIGGGANALTLLP